MDKGKRSSKQLLVAKAAMILDGASLLAAGGLNYTVIFAAAVLGLICWRGANGVARRSRRPANIQTAGDPDDR